MATTQSERYGMITVTAKQSAAVSANKMPALR